MSKLNKIDAAIRDYYQKKNLPVSSDLITAILYSVDSGGKRIRPLIFLDLLEGFGLELTPSQQAPSVQVLISVSKRYFKHAVKRNRVKRQIPP